MNDTEPLLAWYASLTPDTVGRAGEFYAADAQFRDPFNDVCGVAAIVAIFRHMFVHTEQPRFICIEPALIQPDTLAAGAEWVGRQRIEVSPAGSEPASV